MSTRLLHPAIQDGQRKGNSQFSGGTLACKCSERTVKVKVAAPIAHNHACGCTKCWKPEGAAFSVVAVAPTEKVSVIENGDKLAVIDPGALIQRHACKECGVHMYGPVERDMHSRDYPSSIRNGSKMQTGQNQNSQPSYLRSLKVALIPMKWQAYGPG